MIGSAVLPSKCLVPCALCLAWGTAPLEYWGGELRVSRSAL
jgi:hypothetical protein